MEYDLNSLVRQTIRMKELALEEMEKEQGTIDTDRQYEAAQALENINRGLDRIRSSPVGTAFALYVQARGGSLEQMIAGAEQGARAGALGGALTVMGTALSGRNRQTKDAGSAGFVLRRDVEHREVPTSSPEDSAKVRFNREIDNKGTDNRLSGPASPKSPPASPPSPVRPTPLLATRVPPAPAAGGTKPPAGGGQPPGVAPSKSALILHRGTVQPWATLHTGDIHDLGEGTYWSLSSRAAQIYANERRGQYQDTLPKSPSGKVPSSPPGIILTSELSTNQLKVLDLYNTPLRADFENYVKRTLSMSKAQLELAETFLSGRASSKLYNSLFYGWARSHIPPIDPDAYDVVIGPEYRNKSSQVCIKKPGLAEQLDQSARITGIATDAPTGRK